MKYKVKFWFRYDNPKRFYWVVDDKSLTLLEEKANQFDMLDACGHVERLDKIFGYKVATELVGVSFNG